MLIQGSPGSATARPRLMARGHVIAIAAIFTVASFVNRQDAIDHWHGAHEDN